MKCWIYFCSLLFLLSSSRRGKEFLLLYLCFYSSFQLLLPLLLKHFSPVLITPPFFAAACYSAHPFCYWKNSEEVSIIPQLNTTFLVSVNREKGRVDGRWWDITGDGSCFYHQKPALLPSCHWSRDARSVCKSAPELLTWLTSSSYHIKVISLLRVSCGHQLACMQDFW